MVDIQLYIFLIISFLFIIILLIKKHDYKQFHWLFIGFMIMYNIFPALNFMDIKPSFVRINLDLIYRSDLIKLQLIISYLCIAIYGVLLLLFENKIKLNKDYIIKKSLTINVIYIYLMLYPIALYFVINFPWPEHGESISFGNSIAAYIKNIELVLLVMIFIYHPKSYNILFLFSYIILILIDTQRTPLLVAFIAYLILSDNSKPLRYIFFAFIGVFILSIIAIYRNGVDISLVNMLYPFYNEGIFGSYCVLQSLEIVRLYDYNIVTSMRLLISPINDIIIKLIPSFYFDIFNVNKQDFYMLSSFLNENIELGILTEAWTPMGGFFYIAESNLMIPYIGPILFTILLFFITNKIVHMKNPVLKVLLYSNLFLYIKANIFIATKYIIFLLIAYYTIIFIDKIFKILLSNYKNKKVSYI